MSITFPINNKTTTVIKDIIQNSNNSEATKELARIINKFHDSKEYGYNSAELKEIKIEIESFIQKSNNQITDEQRELLGDMLVAANYGTGNGKSNRSDIKNFLNTHDASAWDKFLTIADKYNSGIKIDDNPKNIKDQTVKAKTYEFASMKADQNNISDTAKFLLTIDKVIKDSVNENSLPENANVVLNMNFSFEDYAVDIIGAEGEKTDHQSNRYLNSERREDVYKKIETIAKKLNKYNEAKTTYENGNLTIVRTVKKSDGKNYTVTLIINKPQVVIYSDKKVDAKYKNLLKNNLTSKNLFGLYNKLSNGNGWNVFIDKLNYRKTPARFSNAVKAYNEISTPKITEKEMTVLEKADSEVRELMRTTQLKINGEINYTQISLNNHQDLDILLTATYTKTQSGNNLNKQIVVMNIKYGDNKNQGYEIHYDMLTNDIAVHKIENCITTIISSCQRQLKVPTHNILKHLPLAIKASLI